METPRVSTIRHFGFRGGPLCCGLQHLDRLFKNQNTPVFIHVVVTGSVTVMLVEQWEPQHRHREARSTTRKKSVRVARERQREAAALVGLVQESYPLEVEKWYIFEHSFVFYVPPPVGVSILPPVGVSCLQTSFVQLSLSAPSTKSKSKCRRVQSSANAKDK